MVADCGAVLQVEPANLKALYRRASALSSLGTPASVAAASADLARILAAEPSNAQARQLVKLLAAESAAAAPLPVPPRAVVAVAATTIDVEALKRRAQQQLGDGQYEKVIALLGSYLRTAHEEPFSALLESDRTSLLHLLAAAYCALQEPLHAVAVYCTILEIDPTNTRALHKRAEAQLKIAAEVSDV